MKKKYVKPNLSKESMEHRSVTVRTCSTADDDWGPIETGMEDDDGNALIIFVTELVDCTISESDYMAEYGGTGDGSCLYASTSDGATFNS